MPNASEETRPGQSDTPGTHPTEGDGRRHEEFCSPRVHAQAEAEMPEGSPRGCVGAIIETRFSLKGSNIGGWWTQRERGGPAVFALDWKLMFGELSIEQLHLIYDVLMDTDMRTVTDVLEFVTTAIVEHDGMHPAESEESK